MAVEGELVYQFEVDGQKYTWRQFSDLTVSFLSHAKQWFGAEYGAVHGFNRLLLMGDGDAVRCALWGAAKGALPEPNRMDDFSIGELLQNTPVEVAKGTGKSRGRAPRTQRSTETSTSSEENG